MPFTYEEGLDSNTLTAVIDGESFQGKAVMKGAATTRTLFGPGWDVSTVTGYTATGDARALLFGSKGSSLRCEMTFADAMMGASAGGVGVCQTATGAPST